MDDDTRSRTFYWTDPAKLAKIVETMSGLEYLYAMRDGLAEGSPVEMLLGFRLAEAEAGRVVFEITPSELHYNPFGSVLGGVAAAVIDAATGAVIHSLLPAGVRHTSLDLNVNYARPITSEAGKLRCEARIVHMGTRTGICEARLSDVQGRLYAFGTSTSMIFR